MPFKRYWILLMVAIASCYGCFVFISTMYHNTTFNDLRNRVVGSRLAADDKDPYFYKYNPASDSTNILDPYERRAWIVNGNTITPTAMAITYPVHQLQQKNVNLIWLIISCVGFAIALFFLFSLEKSTSLFIGIGMLMSGAWFLHLFKGQMYILYTALAILSIAAYAKDKKVLAIVSATLLFAMRPNSLILIILLLLGSWRYWKYWIIFSFAWLIMPMLVFGNMEIWQSYFSAMHWHGLENANQIPELKVADIEIPKFLEGWPTSANTAAIERLIEPDIASVQKILVQLNLPSGSLVLLFLLAIAYTCIYFFTNGNNRNKLSAPNTILLAAIAYCISDYFLPAVRFNYNFVQILIPFAIINIYKLNVPKIATVTAFIGLVLQIKKLSWIPECYTVGEGLMLLSLLIIARTNNKNATVKE